MSIRDLKSALAAEFARDELRLFIGVHIDCPTRFSLSPVTRLSGTPVKIGPRSAGLPLSIRSEKARTVPLRDKGNPLPGAVRVSRLCCRPSGSGCLYELNVNALEVATAMSSI